MNIKLYFHLFFRGSSISFQNENINSIFTGRNASCAAGHLFYMHLSEKTLLALGWVKTDYDCMVLRPRQNKTTLDNLRLDVKLNDWVCGLRGTIKAQWSQEIRLACSPKLYFQGMLLRRRLLEISSQLINLCMPQKYSFLTISQPSYPVKTKPHDKSSFIVLSNVLIGILKHQIIIFKLFCVSVSHQRGR